ncbi:unnamed protein product, partial [Ectocarpus sp. 12 AP-2014]
KHRITSILRNTYNQVSFQLQLHNHEDVHERAEVALTRRKSRRRAKAAASSASHQHHPHHPRNPGGTAETNRSSSMTLTAATGPSTPHTPADMATPRTVSRATGVEGGRSGIATPTEDGTEPRTDGHGGGGSGGHGSRVMPGTKAARGTDTMSKDREGDVRPAAPVDPPSSSATSGRRFRRPSEPVWGGDI